MHSKYNATYQLTVHTIWHAETNTSKEYLDIRKAYAGES